MIRVADYIVHFLVNYGVRHIFMLTGGGAMHLNDAIGREKRLQYICNHHEQACAIAAEGYARISGLPGVVCVTTGPGGTNAMTGVLGEWLDSIPVLYLSGQVRYDTTVASTGLPLRQFGDQEANIIELVRPITKYAEMVIDPLSIRFHLEKALYLALHGRPGPVWLDIPLNIQAAIIDEYNLTPYHFDESQTDYDEQAVANQIQLLFQKIAAAERPVILAGAGIRLANAAQDFFELAEKLNIPVQAAWDAIDLFPSDHPLYAGRPSTLGQRGANFIFQNSDLLISIGCRLNTRQIGYTFAAVARSAYKVSVDVDENELIKPSIKIDMPVHADAGFFIRQMLAESEKHIIPVKNDWLDWCRKRQLRYPTVVPHNKRRSKFVDPYIFSETLSKQLQPDDIIVSSNGASCVIPIQALQIQHGQRHVVNSGCAAMGYGLPAAVGACFANNQKRVIILSIYKFYNIL